MPNKIFFKLNGYAIIEERNVIGCYVIYKNNERSSLCFGGLDAAKLFILDRIEKQLDYPLFVSKPQNTISDYFKKYKKQIL